MTSFFTTAFPDQAKIYPHIGKFLWNTESVNLYATNIKSSDTSHKLTNFLHTEFKTSDEAVTQFNSLLQEAAKTSAKFVKGKIKCKYKKPSRKPYFTESCKDLRSTVKHYASLINKFPFNGSFRKEYYSYLSKYRRKCKQEQNHYKNNINKELYNNMSKDPKSFWGQLNKLNKSSNLNNSEDITNKDDFLKFFQTLNKYESSKNNLFDDGILTKLAELSTNITNDNSYFNDPISADKILKAVKSLKNGKSTSSDLISNEMIKAGDANAVIPTVKTFQHCFRPRVIPKTME